jgi:uncharacterized membrane protein YeaQ/YmgE (transglycosylase-associated protein family)
MTGHVLGWMVAGLIVGAVARFLVPGKQELGLVMTMALGIVGALVGGCLGNALFGPNLMTDPNAGYAVETAWRGWIVSIVGGVLVLWGANALLARRA